MPSTPERGVDDEVEAMLRAAWYYFVGGLNQSEIADRLGLTRVKVNRRVGLARERGHVAIRITHPSARLMELEHRFAATFGLDRARIVPALGPDMGDGDAVADRRAVAIAGAAFLETVLATKPDAIVGVGWGGTIGEMVDQVAVTAAPRATFVSLMGSLTRQAAANPFESVLKLAEKTRGLAHFLAAPTMADTLADRQVFLAQRTVRDTLAIAERADIHLVGVTEASRRSFLLTQAIVTPDEMADAEAHGAVGSLVGLFFDRHGGIVDCDVNRRRIGVEPAVLVPKKVTALVSGRPKTEALLAALRGRLFGGIVTDEILARAVLEAAQ
jgi:DNA-binding transcriptional regulator LsrR (DeoR family)